MKARLQRLSEKLLEVCESLYLYAHGWKKLRGDYWIPPPGYLWKQGKTDYRKGHALNSQKFTQHNSRWRN